MALKRADIRTILENTETSNDDKAKAILDALHKETDELKDQLDAEKTARTQAEKDRDAANGGKEAAEKALTDYKAQQTAAASKGGKKPPRSSSCSSRRECWKSTSTTLPTIPRRATSSLPGWNWTRWQGERRRKAAFQHQNHMGRQNCHHQNHRRKCGHPAHQLRRNFSRGFQKDEP